MQNIPGARVGHSQEFRETLLHRIGASEAVGVVSVDLAEDFAVITLQTRPEILAESGEAVEIGAFVATHPEIWERSGRKRITEH